MGAGVVTVLLHHGHEPAASSAHLQVADMKTATGLGAEYDCEAGLAKWKKGWSDSKKDWCCKHEKKGCEDPFDCEAGLDNWQKGWADKKKTWCCAHKKKGCPEQSDCVAG